LNKKGKAKNAKTLGLVKCPFCNCHFASEEDLKLHIWRLHTGRPFMVAPRGGKRPKKFAKPRKGKAVRQGHETAYKKVSSP